MSLRKRHENELDSTKEADNLRECTCNMQRHSVEPSLVKVPRIIESICTPNVIAMEYLDGVLLSDAIRHEQDSVARAMGREDDKDLKRALVGRMREHFENGGRDESGGMRMLGGDNGKMKIVNALGPSVATVALRTYVSVRNSVKNAATSVAKFGSRLRSGSWIHGVDGLDTVWIMLAPGTPRRRR